MASLRALDSPRRTRWLQGWIFLGISFLVGLTLAASGYTALRRGVVLPAVRPGLIAMWAFRSSTGSEAADSVGGAEGRILNPMWVEGRGYLALRFDGLSTVVEVPSAVIAGADGSLTLTSWVKPESVRERQILLVSYGGSADEDLHTAPVAVYAPWGNGRLGLVLYDGDRRVGFLSDETIAKNRWQHIAVTLDGKTGRIRFYIDGSLAGERETTVIPHEASEPLCVLIGAESSAPPGRFGLRGELDSVGVYDRELSQSEVEALARGER